MDFPPFTAALDAGYTLLLSLVSVLHPVAGTASAAVAIVLVTVLVRFALIPVGVALARSERTRRRLAPALAELQRRYRSSPRVLREKTLELYAREKASPAAGCLPLLVQAPVLTLLYSLFALPTIAGHANALLETGLGGADLGTSFVTAVAAGPALAPLAVYLIVLAVIGGAAALTRALTLRWAAASAVAGLGVASTAPGSEQLMAVMSWLPFLTLAFAAVAPLAAALYLAVSSSWSILERWTLRRLVVERVAPS